MGLAKISTRNVVACAPDESVLHAAQLMRDHGVGDVVIVRDGKPVGIITDRDITVAVVAAERDAAEVLCGEMMSKDLVTIYREQSPDEALRLMADKHVRRLPVVDENGRCVGIVTLDDCLVLLSAEMNDGRRIILYERDKASATKAAGAKGKRFSSRSLKDTEGVR